MVSAGVIVGLLSVGQVGMLPHLGSLTEELRGPARLSIAPDDSVFVTDPLSNHIVRFDASGTLVGSWSVQKGPIGVAVHPDGRVFVSLRDEPKVAIYDSTMALLGYLGEGNPLVSFAGPTDIDIASDTGKIYVVDAEGDRIYGFESDGSLALRLGSRGSWPGEFIYPSAITIDEAGNRLIVADHDKSRLQTFTRAGVFLRQYGDRLKSAQYTLEGWMPRPLGLDVDPGGDVYLTDALMGTVRVFDPAGIEVGKILEYGHEPGQLRIPCDLAVSNDGSRLYVVNSGNSSVEVYDLTEGVGASIDTPAGTVSTAVEPASETLTRSDDEGSGTPEQDAQGFIAAEVSRETSWNGPHIVEDRPDICGPCHGITGQPGGHAGTVEGQAVLCTSCHSVTGRALQVPIHERDVADPFGTNNAAVDGRGRSHAWGVPAVNPLADAVGPVPGGSMSSYLDFDGNIKCATCHNQHNTYYGQSYLRVSNDADAMCKECHAPRDLGPKEGGSHPVGFVYPAGDGEYPVPGELAALPLKNDAMECTTCHAPHAADSGGANGGDGDGMLLRSANDETLCLICHTEHAIHGVGGDWEPTCGECHAIHDVENENTVLIAREINGTPVSFLEESGSCGGRKDFIHSDCDPPGFDGVCEVCHTDTDYHRNNPEMDHVHEVDTVCTDCHPHSLGFLTACTACHGEPPDGAVSPNVAGSHAAHFTAANGPGITDCGICHASDLGATHDNGTASFASGVDLNLDGNIDLSETDVCDECHGAGEPFDGVDDPVIGAKPNWADGVYEAGVLKPEKLDWCAGCHDATGAIIDDVEAPLVMGDNETWGYNISGLGKNHVICTDCHDPTLPHTDGESPTFGERFPLSPGGTAKIGEARELDKEAYNDGYRLRRIDGGRALEVPRDGLDYTANDFRLCFSCHDEIKIMGVPANYGTLLSTPPEYLQLPEGVAQTNYRNEQPWGYGSWYYQGSPANPHWNHIGSSSSGWDIDHDDAMKDSRRSCVTCHNPHGTRTPDGEPTPALMMADLAITFGVYNDGTTDYDYGYIGSDEFTRAGGDLHCNTCHSNVGPGDDPTDQGPLHTRYYREVLDLWRDECRTCHDDGDRGIGASVQDESSALADELPPGHAASCSFVGAEDTSIDCQACHDMRGHRRGRMRFNDGVQKWNLRFRARDREGDR